MPKSNLAYRTCKPLPAGTKPLTPAKIKALLREVSRWKIIAGELSKTFNFENYYQTMAFVNAVAFIAHGQDHHPDMAVGYNKLVIRFSTHLVGGLSISDFICAAKVDGLK